MKKLAHVWVLFLAVVISAILSWGGSIELTTSADTGARDITPTPDPPQGSNDKIYVTVDNAVSIIYSRKAWLRFDMSTVAGTITSATLTLTQTGTYPTFHLTTDAYRINVFGLNDGDSGDGNDDGENWDEATVVWASGPASVISHALNFEASRSTSLGQLLQPGMPSIPNGTDVDGSEWTLTGQALVDFLNANTDGKVTLMLSWEHPGFNNLHHVGFDSKDTADAPPTPPKLSLVTRTGGTVIRIR